MKRVKLYQVQTRQNVWCIVEGRHPGNAEYKACHNIHVIKTLNRPYINTAETVELVGIRL